MSEIYELRFIIPQKVVSQFFNIFTLSLVIAIIIFAHNAPKIFIIIRNLPHGIHFIFTIIVFNRNMIFKGIGNTYLKINW